MRKVLVVFLLLLCCGHAYAQRFTPPSGLSLNPFDSLSRGLVGWWISTPRQMGGTLWYPQVGKDRGTLTNMVLTTSGWQSTVRPGGAGEMKFDGTDDQVTVGTTTLLANLPSFTVCLWFRSTSSAGQQFYTENIGGWPDMMMVIGWQSGAISLNNYDAAVGMEIYGVPPVAIDSNIWQHTCGVQYTKSSGDVYSNGRRITTTVAGSLGAVAPTQRAFGATPQGTNRLVGAMDDIRTYTRALSAPEIMQLYLQSSTGYQQTLVPSGTVVSVLPSNSNAFFNFFSPSAR